MVGLLNSRTTRCVFAVLAGCLLFSSLGTVSFPGGIPSLGATAAIAQEETLSETDMFSDSKVQELLGPSIVAQVVNFLHYLYGFVRKGIVLLLEKTVFHQNKKLAGFYGDVASFLASLTAIYLLLLLVNSAKKIVGVVLFLGWALFVVALVVRL